MSCPPTGESFLATGDTWRHNSPVTSVPCRVLAISSDDEQFVLVLREYNRHAEKTADERLREEVVSVNPTEAYQALLDHRCAASKIDAPALDIVGEKRRCEISKAKKPMLDAIRQVLQDRREFWPLSDRAIHYALLNDPPLKHALKPDSTYDNTPRSYNALTELLTRRLAGEIPMHAIADVTRPVITWNVHREPGAFIGQQFDGFVKSYWRDLLQSQPNHFEIVGEKNTVESIIRPVAMEYCIPLTIGRGYCASAQGGDSRPIP